MTKIREVKRFPKIEDRMYTETREKMNLAVKLYLLERKEVPEIATELGVGSKTVYYYLRLRNIPLRSQKRDNRGKFIGT